MYGILESISILVAEPHANYVKSFVDYFAIGKEFVLKRTILSDPSSLPSRNSDQRVIVYMREMLCGHLPKISAARTTSVFPGAIVLLSQNEVYRALFSIHLRKGHNVHLPTWNGFLSQKLYRR